VLFSHNYGDDTSSASLPPAKNVTTCWCRSGERWCEQLCDQSRRSRL